MKQIKRALIGTLIAFALVTGIFISGNALSQKTGLNPSGSNGFAVLELFTSEGCSSCPPAEELMSKINKESAGKPVYVLTYHVDYWDCLGWKDAFSDAKFSERQYDYNRKLSADVYTPQLVINGTSECIGSNKTAVSNAIDKALNSAATNTLDLQGKLQNGNLGIDYKIGNTVHNLQLVAAVVQRNAVSHVKAGENEGRTLPHVQVVRKLYTYDLKQTTTGNWEIKLPKEFNATDYEMIGWLQNQSSGSIEAAGRVTIHASGDNQ